MPERFAEAMSLREMQQQNRLVSKTKGLSQSIWNTPTARIPEGSGSSTS